MFAIVCEEQGPVIQEVPVPVCRSSEVRVKVSRCALNRVDLSMAAGALHGTTGGRGTVLGLEWSGIVDAVGSEVPKTIQVGQAVMGSGRSAFAQYVVADWGRVLPIPDGLRDFSEAAVLPIALQTMHDAMFTRGDFDSGKKLIIHGATSAVGMMALKISQCYGNDCVIGTSTAASKLERLQAMGLKHPVNSRASDWDAQVMEITGGRGADLALDMISGPGINTLLASMCHEGRIINIGRLGGKASEFDFNLHALKRISYIGVTFRTRTADHVREITRKMLKDFSGLIGAGKLNLPVDSNYSFEEFGKALERMRTNQHFGKIVLSID